MKRAGQFVIFSAVLALAACSATYSNHGYVPRQEVLDNLVIGADTRETVADIAGSPSSSGVMADGGWYYIHSRVRNFAYRKPEIVERDMVALTFDAQGQLSNIETYTLEDGKAVRLSRRVTEGPVKNKGILRQLLSNFGNFNAGDFFEQEARDF